MITAYWSRRGCHVVGESVVSEWEPLRSKGFLFCIELKIVSVECESGGWYEIGGKRLLDLIQPPALRF